MGDALKKPKSFICMFAILCTCSEVQIAELGRLLAETDVAPIMVGKAEVQHAHTHTRVCIICFIQ